MIKKEYIDFAFLLSLYREEGPHANMVSYLHHLYATTSGYARLVKLRDSLKSHNALWMDYGGRHGWKVYSAVTGKEIEWI